MRQILLSIISLVAILGFIVWWTTKDDSTASPGTVAVPSTDTVTDSDDGTDDTSREDDGLSLDLSGRGLTKVPPSVFTRSSLEKLDLSGNALSGSLQAEINGLQNLKELDLSDNQFTGVPAEIGQLKELEILDLSNNQLTGLPYELGNLSRLRLLRLTGNDYSKADLEVIKGKLPASTVIELD